MSSYPGDLEARKWLQRVVSALVVIGCGVYVFWVVHPNLVLRDTTPTGGDMGAHVWGPAYLGDHLLPELRITGWAPDWYAGLPAYRFYMVLPALVIVVLNAGGAVGVVDVDGVLAHHRPPQRPGDVASRLKE